MNIFKKTLAILLITSLSALAACSDDSDKKASNNANNINNLNNTNNVNNTNNDEQDTGTSDIEENDQDVEENDEQDVEENEQDAEENDQDTKEPTDEDEVDGNLLLKDLTAEQVNALCAYKFDQLEPTYDPAVPAGEGNCFFWGIDDSYMVENSEKVATCQESMDACMNRGYKRENIVTEGCMDEIVRADCDITVDEYKTCANDRAAASIAHNILMLEKTCADLATASGRNAIEDLMFAYENPESCVNLDNKCEFLEKHMTEQ